MRNLNNYCTNIVSNLSSNKLFGLNSILIGHDGPCEAIIYVCSDSYIISLYYQIWNNQTKKTSQGVVDVAIVGIDEGEIHF